MAAPRPGCAHITQPREEAAGCLGGRRRGRAARRAKQRRHVRCSTRQLHALAVGDTSGGGAASRAEVARRRRAPRRVEPLRPGCVGSRAASAVHGREQRRRGLCFLLRLATATCGGATTGTTTARLPAAGCSRRRAGRVAVPVVGQEHLAGGGAVAERVAAVCDQLWFPAGAPTTCPPGEGRRWWWRREVEVASHAGPRVVADAQLAVFGAEVRVFLSRLS